LGSLEDDDEQRVVVRKQLQASVRLGDQVYLIQIILVETAWLLRSLFAKADVLATFERYWMTIAFSVSHPPMWRPRTRQNPGRAIFLIT
jgi:hypothetical protein